eukprot:CAMPEP_0172371360 /NCGR_PEP_ID=MMETSP1060-20121228/42400_1 /TAXON_ID=37318 /ORGANISM="Pseudo-nitzschia pungens, Strain cf. cingulata" /LENGTH=506 /DNA_ID=CAMNT_0013096951 /DNA_START=826 /DNA_END=2343 /DNA_ORIENTATION=+
MGCTDNKNQNNCVTSSDRSPFHSAKDATIAEAVKEDVTTVSVSSITTSSSSSYDTIPSGKEDKSSAANAITASEIQEKICAMLLDIEREQKQQEKQLNRQHYQGEVHDSRGLQKLKQQMEELQEMLPSLRLEPSHSSHETSSTTSSSTDHAAPGSSNSSNKIKSIFVRRDRNPSMITKKDGNPIHDIAQRAKSRRRQLHRENARISRKYGPESQSSETTRSQYHCHNHFTPIQSSHPQSGKMYWFVPGSHSHLFGSPFQPPPEAMTFESLPCDNNYPPSTPNHPGSECNAGETMNPPHRWKIHPHPALYTPWSSSPQPRIPNGRSTHSTPRSRNNPVARAPTSPHPPSQNLWQSAEAASPTPRHQYSPGSSPEPKIPDVVYPHSEQHVAFPAASPPFASLPPTLDSSTTDDPQSNHNHGPLTASRLASASPEDQKEMIGEQLYERISRSNPSLADRLTGILLESGDCYELLNLLESPEELLRDRVADVLRVLEGHQSPAVLRIGLE